jgi:hypothetical protein
LSEEKKKEKEEGRGEGGRETIREERGGWGMEGYGRVLEG